MFLSVLFAGHLAAPDRQIDFRPMKPGINMIPSKEDLSQPIYDIKGNNRTIDMKGIILQGTDRTSNPISAKDFACELPEQYHPQDITIHGYKVAIIAENCKNLKLIDCDLSYNWKQHLMSTSKRKTRATG